jgi:hypothetical protein
MDDARLRRHERTGDRARDSEGREFWAKLISEFESSNGRESHSGFAARHGVLLTTFRTWLYRLRIQEAPRAKRAVRVLPATVVGADRSSRELSIDCNGVALRFGADIDPSYVAALVVALRAC